MLSSIMNKHLLNYNLKAIYHLSKRILTKIYKKQQENQQQENLTKWTIKKVDLLQAQV